MTKEMRSEKINDIAVVMATRIQQENPQSFNELHSLIATLLREWINGDNTW